MSHSNSPRTCCPAHAKQDKALNLDRRTLLQGGAAVGLTAAAAVATGHSNAFGQDAVDASGRIPSIGWASIAKDQPLQRYEFTRAAPGSRDMLIDILYCGVCHSDIHQATDNLGHGGVWPVVPGHEIVGRVRRTGPGVTKFSEGQIIGVTTYVGSGDCAHGMPQYCNPIWTYAGQLGNGEITQGGYSSNIVVSEDFAVSIPEGMDLRRAAPLMCAGLTPDWPLNQWEVGPGDRVGVIGLGGLGHMAVKLAKDLGATVTVFTTTPGKVEEARRLGADDVVVWPDQGAFMQRFRQFDYLLSTVPYDYPMDGFMMLLRPGGGFTNVGLLEGANVNFALMNVFQINMTGSVVGSIDDLQTLINRCHTKNILPDVEMIRIDQINEAYDRIMNKDVNFRFVIDMATLS